MEITHDQEKRGLGVLACEAWYEEWKVWWKEGGEEKRKFRSRLESEESEKGNKNDFWRERVEGI